MPFSTAATDAITRRAPKFISPKAHAVIDYLMIGTFFVTGALFWRRNRRAAISALMCGGAELTNTLFTDYPGGVAPVISFPFHRKIDFGLAAMTATMPEFMSFHGHPENKFFVTQAAIITAVTNLTNTGRRRRFSEKRRLGAA
ncbi:MAG: hypothetical protein DMG87_06540 [Acidobacteria bacterium]|nr:MAG: hypothetical protein DMG87_06540 [Acidobacteriota bacterium]